MTKPWAEVDARRHGEVDPCDVVAGLPLVVRALRQLARLGWTGARVAADDEAGAARIRAALGRWPVPVKLDVEVVVAGTVESRPGAVALDGCSVYARDALAAASADAPPVPLVAVRAPADRARARAALFAGIRKSVALDGLVSYYVIRPLTRPLVRLLVNTPVTPNMVTLGALVCGLSAAVIASRGGATATLIAGLLYWAGGAIDHMDGDLARLRLTSSKVGEWLDSMTDEISTYAMCAGLGIGLVRDGHHDAWAALGLGAALAGVVAMAPLYRELHRRGLPIDTAQFPWFFQDGGGDTAERKGAAKVVYLLGFLVRRDVNITVVAILLALNLRPFALIGIALGAAVGLVLTSLHYTVVALRRGRAA